MKDNKNIFLEEVREFKCKRNKQRQSTAYVFAPAHIKPVKAYKLTGREKAIFNWFVKNGYSAKLANFALDYKIDLALELGMVLEPYCLDRLYTKGIRIKVALAQATNYLYNYFVKGYALQ